MPAQPLNTIEHTFTHFDLVITPLLARCAGAQAVREAPLVDELQCLWYNPRQPARVGLPAPIRTLLTRLADPTMFDGAS